MPRYWTTHWKNTFWHPDVNDEGLPIRASGSSSFRKRGIAPGDVLYVVSLESGLLCLGGRMTVKEIASRERAVNLLKSDGLYDASEWAIDPGQGGTPLHLHRHLAPALTKLLQFHTAKGVRSLAFVTDTKLDNQATRGIHELTIESAALLDRIISATDPLPKNDDVITVTEEHLSQAPPSTVTDRATGQQNSPPHAEPTLPINLSDQQTAFSASVEQSLQDSSTERQQRLQNAAKLPAKVKAITEVFLRNSDVVAEVLYRAQGKCEHCHQPAPFLRKKNGSPYLEVHHKKQLANGGEDTVENALALCPNCHRELHFGVPIA